MQTPIACGAALVASLVLFAPVAHAQEDPGDEPELVSGLQFALKIEPGVAIPLNNPQTGVYDIGGSQTIKLLFGLTPYFDLGPSASFTMLPTDADAATFGTAWTVGGGARFMRPHDGAGGFMNLAAISPWLDADALYVRTGDLDRFGLAIAVGAGVPLDHDRNFWLGPFVRYTHILQGNRLGFDNGDARLLNVGLSFEFGRGVEYPVEREVVHEVEVRVVTKVITPVVVPAPNRDRDNDGVTNEADHCPDVTGKVDNWGCPQYNKVIVKRDKLELTEKIAFEFDSAKLDAVSYPLLDEVVRALADLKSYRVQVDGHASSEGLEAHNQLLSEERAEAVLAYLVAHGIEKERLVSKGFSSSVPIATNDTSAGREKNRRVEFVLSFIILPERSAP